MLAPIQTCRRGPADSRIPQIGGLPFQQILTGVAVEDGSRASQSAHGFIQDVVEISYRSARHVWAERPTVSRPL